MRRPSWTAEREIEASLDSADDSIYDDCVGYCNCNFCGGAWEPAIPYDDSPCDAVVAYLLGPTPLRVTFLESFKTVPRGTARARAR